MKIYLPNTEEIDDLITQVANTFPNAGIDVRQMIEVETNSKPVADFFHYLAEITGETSAPAPAQANHRRKPSETLSLDGERTCKKCGAGFVPVHGKQQYCELHTPKKHRPKEALPSSTAVTAVLQ